MNFNKMHASFVAVSIILSCSFLNGNPNQYPQTIYESKDLMFYSINPETSLENLQQGNSDILTPIVATPDPYPLSPDINKSYMWTYQEYLNASEVLAKSTWTDGLEKWKLRSMYFNVDCQDPLFGFTIGDFYYFKEFEKNGKSEYSGREILIRPLYADVTIGSGTAYPKLAFGWANIDLSNVVNDADKALQIAENNGGKNFRLSVNNNCQVFLSFNPNTEYEGWKILYSTGKADKFVIHVSAYANSYKIIK